MQMRGPLYSSIDDVELPSDISAFEPTGLLEEGDGLGPTLSGEKLLWGAWRMRQDASARARLVEHYLPYARIVAASYYRRRFHDEIEFAEYLQFASVGLLESIDRYDPGLGAGFKTFAARRMHGAILNGLELVTEKQQQISVRKKLQAERQESLKSSEKKQGKDTTDTLFRELADVGIGLALAYLLDGTGMIEGSTELDERHGYYQHVELKQLRLRVRALVDDLSEQERTVVHCHYMQEMPFIDIAAMLGLSKGRIAQIHKQALERLRHSVQGSGGLDLLL
ncbi:sigma-70 family RNA polymerase sigma factor [Herbaspirillum sp. WGmk3]|uniref:sigma-70 family RNA polymerase sigma factor n=1 Tax=Herbaspirillum sp. WGmk3 TaxID=2919925 RepID=UPI0020916463|nr:sigma-70 family RNA polymerase sigma factor [Herbaspirillum sp. WGmk3]MCO4855921.1 sigma-70 family RNA polymerase sigma factor [Herbaspirillum sp. WGmk3]